MLSSLCDIHLSRKLRSDTLQTNDTDVAWTKCEENKYYPSLIQHYRYDLGKLLNKRSIFTSNHVIFDKGRYFVLTKPIYGNPHFHNIDERGKKTTPSVIFHYSAITPLSENRCRMVYVVIENVGGVLSRLSRIMFRHAKVMFCNKYLAQLKKMKKTNYKDLRDGFELVRTCLDYHSQHFTKQPPNCPFPNTFEEFQARYGEHKYSST